MSTAQARDVAAQLISTVECCNVPGFDDLLTQAAEMPTVDIEQAIVTLLAAGFSAGLYDDEGVW